jgi:hypothetical protein
MPKTVPQSHRDRLYAHLSQVARTSSTILPKSTFSSSSSDPASHSTVTVSATSSGGANTSGWLYPHHSVFTRRGYLARGRGRFPTRARARAFGGFRGGRTAFTSVVSERSGQSRPSQSDSGSRSVEYDSSSDGWGHPPRHAEAEARATSGSKLGPSNHGTGTQKKHDTHDTLNHQKHHHEKHEQRENPLRHDTSSTGHTGSGTFGHCSSCVLPLPQPLRLSSPPLAGLRPLPSDPQLGQKETQTTTTTTTILTRESRAPQRAERSSVGFLTDHIQ